MAPILKHVSCCTALALIPILTREGIKTATRADKGNGGKSRSPILLSASKNNAVGRIAIGHFFKTLTRIEEGCSPLRS